MPIHFSDMLRIDKDDMGGADMIEEGQVRIIEVVSHNPQWVDDYSREAERLCNVFKEEVVDIYHIGSTSIPGLAAKPIIDILLEVNSIGEIDTYNGSMEALGYIAKGEYGIAGRRFFLRGLHHRTHHVHVFQLGNPEVIRHLNFRDYMVNHPEEARQYEILKKRLALEYRYDNDGYCNGKDAFIKSIDKRAEEWASKIRRTQKSYR